MSRLYRSNLARTAVASDKETLQAMRQRFRAGEIMRYVIRPLSLSILVLCLLIGTVSIISFVTLDERWSSLTILLFLVTLEAIVTTNWLQHPDRLQLDRTAYRAAELLLILIVVRLVSWVIFEGALPNSSQLQSFLANPTQFFLNGPFLVSLALAFAAWQLAVILSGIFKNLEVSEFELRFYSLPLAQRKALSDDQPIQFGRRRLVQNFARYWIWGGVFLALVVGLTTLDTLSIDALKNPLVMGTSNLTPQQLILLLVYFSMGFWLLSQAKLMELNARWLVNGIVKDDQMESRWQRTSLLILLVVGLLAAFLPIGPTLAISRILTILIFIVLFIINVLIYLITLPFAIILALLSRTSTEDFQPPPPLIPESLAENTPPSVSAFGESVVLILSSAFWAVFVVVLLLAILFFIRERKSGIEWKSIDQVWNRFIVWLSDLWQRFRHRVGEVRLRLPVQLVREVKEDRVPRSKRRWRFVRIGGLSPREQIRYFYLSTIRRAGESGVPRDPPVTPLEFAQSLKNGWPEVDQEVEDLTGAFLKARYSEDPITNEDLPDVKDTWKDVRRQIRKRPSPVDPDPDQESEES